MKLFYAPGACSLSPHIALHEAGLAHELVKVDLKAKKTENGDDFNVINPKGQVPALMLDSGELLTEGPVIVQYLADLKPGTDLVPAAGTVDHYRELEWLNYLTSEVHQRFYPLFKFPGFSDEAKGDLRADLEKRLTFIAGKLGERAAAKGAQKLATRATCRRR